MNTENTTNIFDDLVNIITKELALYENLLVVSKGKQNAIIADDLNELRENIHSEQTIVQEALSVADTRNEYVYMLKQSLDITDPKPRLRTIIDKSPSDYSIRLTSLKHQLKTNLDQITLTNRENRYLLNSSLEHLKGMINLFLQAGDESVDVYDTKGFMSNPSRGYMVLDCQI
ncbi:MAG: flagellar protein FlgN [Candidatus Hatepunaea meridiana]|nr:flagellar protein FlgN [Candidatus Hatepunaea meridiana]